MTRIPINVIPRLGKVKVDKGKDYESIQVAVEGHNYSIYRDKNGVYWWLPYSKPLKSKMSTYEHWESIFLKDDDINLTLIRFDTGQYSISYTLFKKK